MMMKTLKCQVRFFKEVWNGCKDFLPILHHFIYYLCIYIYIYMYMHMLYIYILYIYDAGTERARPAARLKSPELRRLPDQVGTDGVFTEGPRILTFCNSCFKCAHVATCCHMLSHAAHISRESSLGGVAACSLQNLPQLILVYTGWNSYNKGTPPVASNDLSMRNV